MNASDPPSPGEPETSPPNAPKTSPPLKAPSGVAVFANRRAVVVWGCAGVLGLALFLFDVDEVRGTIGGLLALFALQAAFSFSLGVRIAQERIEAPRAWTWAPLFVLWRTSISLPLLGEITYSGRHLGFEAVRLSGQEGEFETLFDTRDRRHAFFDEVRRRQPSVEIYRVSETEP